VQLAKEIDPDTRIPEYVVQALFAAHRPTRPILANIILYRLKILERDERQNPVAIADMRATVGRYRQGEIDLPEILEAMLASFPADQIVGALRHAE
jgi:putative ATP-dependent endonuclease of OLD family